MTYERKTKTYRAETKACDDLGGFTVKILFDYDKIPGKISTRISLFTPRFNTECLREWCINYPELLGDTFAEGRALNIIQHCQSEIYRCGNKKISLERPALVETEDWINELVPQI